jgi:uncharacterized protein YndB with AHSA1/START domain
MGSEARMMEASRVIDAPAQKIFALLANEREAARAQPQLADGAA